MFPYANEGVACVLEHRVGSFLGLVPDEWRRKSMRTGMWTQAIGSFVATMPAVVTMVQRGGDVGHGPEIVLHTFHVEKDLCLSP